jgi:hypothetical protein
MGKILLSVSIPEAITMLEDFQAQAKEIRK